MTSTSDMNDRLRTLRRRKAGIDHAAPMHLGGSQQRPGPTDMNQVLRDALARRRRPQSSP